MDIPSSEPKKRPYWHLDAKWFFGILFTIILAFAIPLYVIQNNVFTNENGKVIKSEVNKAINKAVGGMIPNLNSDFEKFYPQLLEAARKSPDTIVILKIGSDLINLGVTGSVILASNKAQIKNYVIKAFLTKVGGAQYAMIAKNVDSLPELFSKASQKLRLAFSILLIPTLFFGLLYIIFSEKFKKLLSLGISLLLVTGPQYGLFNLINSAVPKLGKQKYVTLTLVRAFSTITHSIVSSYYNLLLISLGLIIGGIVLQLIYGTTKRTR